jgi:hypothetical protein
MAFSSTTIQTVSTPAIHKLPGNDVAASLLGILLLTAYAAKKSNKSLRKLQRKMMWAALKLKVKSFFSHKSGQVSRNVIIYIILGVLIIALLIISPIAALVLAIIALILLLTGTI